jgi:transcriptional regulator with XRE-family HTH domain
MKNNEKLVRVRADLNELLPNQKALDAFEEASAALEAGRYIRDMRTKARLTQAELGARLSMSQERLSALENGKGRVGPSFGLISRIAAACGFKWHFTPASSETPVTDPIRYRLRDVRHDSTEFFLGGVYALARHKSRRAPHTHIAVVGPRGRVVGNVTAVNVALVSGHEEMIPTETFGFAEKRRPTDVPLMVFDSGGCVVGNVTTVNVVSASGHVEELSAEKLSFDPHEKVFVAAAKPRAGQIAPQSDTAKS